MRLKIYDFTVRLVFAALLWAVWFGLPGAASAAETARRMPVAYNEYTIGEGGDYATIAAWYADRVYYRDMYTLQKGEVGTLLAGVHEGADLEVVHDMTDSMYFPVLRGQPGAIIRPATTPVGQNYVLRLGCESNRGGWWGLYDLTIDAVNCTGLNCALSLLNIGWASVDSVTIKNISSGYGAITVEGSAVNAGTPTICLTNNFILNVRWGISVATGYIQQNTVYMYNNTFVADQASGSYGVLVSVGDIIIGKNNVFSGFGTHVLNDGSTYTATTTLFNPNPAPAWVGGGDYHVTAEDTVLLGQGANLTADAYLQFTKDFDGATRPATWSIGADDVGGTPEPDPEPEPEPETPTVRYAPWGLGPWNGGPWNGGGKFGKWN